MTEFMVIVMPSFAESDKRKNWVIAALIASVVTLEPQAVR
jgi:hypothetical protein